MPLTRAYSVLTVKAVDHEQRTIAGIASTPEPDRMGDVVEPLGITYKNPLPLLLYHDSKKPVGHVKFKKPTAAGLEFTASAADASTSRARCATASTKPGRASRRACWRASRSGSARSKRRSTKTPNGFRFLKTEILELSLVAIPANAGATIQSIKSLDLAASGRHLSRDRDPLPIVRVDKGARPMEQKTIHEQITSFENKPRRQARPDDGHHDQGGGGRRDARPGRDRRIRRPRRRTQVNRRASRAAARARGDEYRQGGADHGRDARGRQQGPRRRADHLGQEPGRPGHRVHSLLPGAGRRRRARGSRRSTTRSGGTTRRRKWSSI